MGARQHSPLVRRILISWTDRQTDRRTLHPLQPCFLGSPRASCLSFWGAAGGLAIGSRSREAPGSSSQIHTQASMYRDTLTQTHTSTHKHAPMPINTHTRTDTHCSTGSTGEHPMGPRRGGVPSSPGLQALPAPQSRAGSEGGQEQVGPGAPKMRGGAYDSDSHFYPLSSRYPPAPPSSQERTRLRPGTWRPSFPCSYGAHVTTS